MMVVRSRRRTCAILGDPLQKDHARKDMWHNQIMTNVKMKLTFQVRISHESK
jgi:hypothetical protein